LMPTAPIGAGSRWRSRSFRSPPSGYSSPRQQPGSTASGSRDRLIFTSRPKNWPADVGSSPPSAKIKRRGPGLDSRRQSASAAGRRAGRHGPQPDPEGPAPRKAGKIEAGAENAFRAAGISPRPSSPQLDERKALRINRAVKQADDPPRPRKALGGTTTRNGAAAPARVEWYIRGTRAGDQQDCVPHAVVEAATTHQRTGRKLPQRPQAASFMASEFMSDQRLKSELIPVSGGKANTGRGQEFTAETAGRNQGAESDLRRPIGSRWRNAQSIRPTFPSGVKINRSISFGRARPRQIKLIESLIRKFRQTSQQSGPLANRP